MLARRQNVHESFSNSHPRYYRHAHAIRITGAVD
jgi:hypothetical protein